MKNIFSYTLQGSDAKLILLHANNSFQVTSSGSPTSLPFPVPILQRIPLLHQQRKRTNQTQLPSNKIQLQLMMILMHDLVPQTSFPMFMSEIIIWRFWGTGYGCIIHVQVYYLHKPSYFIQASCHIQPQEEEKAPILKTLYWGTMPLHTIFSVLWIHIQKLIYIVTQETCP